MATPGALAFDPLDPDTRRDPFPLHARARREALLLAHEGLPLRVFSLFRYQDCQALLRDAEAWSNDFSPGGSGAARTR